MDKIRLSFRHLSKLFQLNVFVQLPQDCMSVNIWMADEQSTQLFVNISTPKKPTFERTISGETRKAVSSLNSLRICIDSFAGRKWHSSFDVEHLTPIHLNVTLPFSYPSTHPPQFTLECLWLSALQLSKLCVQLDALWGEAQQSPVLFVWMDWLRNETLELVSVFSKISLVHHVNNRSS